MFKNIWFPKEIQGFSKPVLSWNGKRGRCKRRSTRTTGRRSCLVQACKTRRQQRQQGTNCNPMHFKKTTSNKGRPPQGGPRTGKFERVPVAARAPMGSRGLPHICSSNVAEEMGKQFLKHVHGYVYVSKRILQNSCRQ